MSRLASALAVVALWGCGGGTVESTGTASTADGGVDRVEADAAAIDGGASGDGGGAVSPICTSATTWTRGNHGSDDMNPGRACLACHATMNGPAFAFGGTVYPTAHEPDLCNGADGSDGAQIVITGADGKTLTLTPGASGNFHSATRVKPPFTAKITFMGRERAMTAMQTSGDCNGCHTQDGANGAPGRIMLP